MSHFSTYRLRNEDFEFPDLLGAGYEYLMLTALYGALYGLLISEDNALLLGALLVFGLLAAAMAITRRVDWYGVGSGKEAGGGK